MDFKANCLSLCSWRKAFLAAVGRWEHHTQMACVKASLLLQMNDSPGCVLTPGIKKELLPKEKENVVCPDPCPGSGCGAVQSRGHS